MAETTVGMRELKAHLSRYLRRVKAGYAVIITERGRPIGRLTPVGQSLEAKVRAIVRAGRADWNGRRLKPVKAPAEAKTARSVAALLIEDRP